jgi:hypothetical protein
VFFPSEVTHQLMRSHALVGAGGRILDIPDNDIRKNFGDCAAWQLAFFAVEFANSFRNVESETWKGPDQSK